MRKQFIKNFSWVYLGEIITKLFTFVMYVYVARVIGAAGFGLLSLAQVILAYMLLFVDTGLSLLGVREISKKPDELSGISVNIFITRMLAAALIMGVSFIVLYAAPLGHEAKLVFALTFLFVVSRAVSSDWLYQGIYRMELVSISRMLHSGLSLLFVFLLVRSPDDIAAVPLVLFFSSLFVVVSFFFVFSVKLIKYQRGIVIPGTWAKYIWLALPLGLSGIFVQIYNSIDSVMIALFWPIKEVGYYNAAYKIIFGLIAFASAFGTIIYPLLSKLHEESSEKMKKYATAFLKYSTMVALPICVGGMLLSSRIISFVYGQQYLGAHAAFQILIWSVLSTYINVVFAYSLLASGHDREYLTGVGAGAAINIVLNLLVIPRYGIAGAAATTLISEASVFLILSYFVSKRLFPIRQLLPGAIKCLVCSIIMGIMVYLLPVHVIAKVVYGALIYFGACVVVRELDINILNHIRKEKQL